MKYNRDQIAQDLLVCRTHAEVCRKNGISEATLYRLKKIPSFQDTLKRMKKAVFDEAMKKAQGYSLAAVEVLMEVATDKEAPQSARVSAAGRILDIGQSVYDSEQIVEKLTELERRIGNETSKN